MPFWLTPCKHIHTGLYDPLHTANLDRFPEFVHFETLYLPSLPNGFNSDIKSNFFAIFETVGNCLGGEKMLTSIPSMRCVSKPYEKAATVQQSKRMGKTLFGVIFRSGRIIQPSAHSDNLSSRCHAAKRRPWISYPAYHPRGILAVSVRLIGPFLLSFS
jgi:hypothetical protein